MKHACTIQLYADKRWHDVAVVRLIGPASDGWRARSYSGYAVEWVVDHAGAKDAHAWLA